MDPFAAADPTAYVLLQQFGDRRDGGRAVGRPGEHAVAQSQAEAAPTGYMDGLAQD